MKKSVEIRWHGRGGQGAKTVVSRDVDVTIGNSTFYRVNK